MIPKGHSPFFSKGHTGLDRSYLLGEFRSESVELIVLSLVSDVGGEVDWSVGGGAFTWWSAGILCLLMSRHRLHINTIPTSESTESSEKQPL